ncbi:UNVERIFIED_CONTAM: hypothetical protein Sradi_3992700 [Sesamum radiatum]|uniref:Uncharacterized protein n=1 Tax=Sesamum radiatum TaxID=300843 RepID=A0AAW2PK61_SESRA
MTNEQYDRLDSVGSMNAPHKMICEAPNRYIEYAATEASFEIKMTEERLYTDMGLRRYLSWRSLRISVLMYIDMILQFLHPSFDLHGWTNKRQRLRNLCRRYWGGRLRPHRRKAKGARHWMRKNDDVESAAASALIAPVASIGEGKGNGKMVRQSRVTK